MVTMQNKKEKRITEEIASLFLKTRRKLKFTEHGENVSVNFVSFWYKNDLQFLGN